MEVGELAQGVELNSYMLTSMMLYFKVVGTMRKAKVKQ